jgi:glycosyltransferase involved in cell wall biosynthesis
MHFWKTLVNRHRIKVLHVITDLNVGGGEMVLYRLLKDINLTRFENLVVSLIPPGKVGEKIQALGVPVYSLKMRSGFPSLRGFFSLVGLLRHESPDLVQTWLYHADLLGLLAAGTTGLPVLWNIRAANMDMSRYRWLSRLVRYLCIRLSGWPMAVVVNSRSGQAFHENLGYRPRRWVYIPNGIDTDQFRPDQSARTALRSELDLAPDALLIGLIARFDPMKDHENFLLAAGFLAEKLPDVHFVLAGNEVDPANPFFGKYLESKELHGRLHLLGQRDDTPRLMAALDIASLSSYGEGFPNAIAEAMSCGTPCVVTDTGDSAYLVEKTGMVVAPKDPQALAEGWQQMIALGPEGRQSLGAAARQRIQLNFHQDTITRQYEQLYESLMPLTS